MKILVLLFVGDDSYSKENAVKNLRSSLAGDSSRDFDYDVFHGGESDPIEALELASTVPFVAKKRLVVIKDLEKSSQSFLSRLLAYVKKPSRSTCLVLESEDDEFISDNKEIAKYCEVRRFDGIKGSGMESWVNKYLSSAGKKITSDALEALGEQHSTDLRFLAYELDKLIAFTGSRDEVNLVDVEEVVTRSLSAQAFDLANAMDKRDIGMAMKVISDLMSGGRKQYEIVGLLCWHIKRIWRAKTFLEQGKDTRYITQTLKIHQRYQNEFLKQVNAMSKVLIQKRMEALLEADLDIKRSRFDPTLVLECAVMRLCLG